MWPLSKSICNGWKLHFINCKRQVPWTGKFWSQSKPSMLCLWWALQMEICTFQIAHSSYKCININRYVHILMDYFKNSLKNTSTSRQTQTHTLQNQRRPYSWFNDKWRGDTLFKAAYNLLCLMTVNEFISWYFCLNFDVTDFTNVFLNDILCLKIISVW